METEFTPIASLAGGVLIGIAAMILLLGNGRIAGISGIVSRLLPPNTGSSSLAEGIAFLGGLLLAFPLYRLVTGDTPEQVISGNYPLLVAAGLLVGFGTVLGSGCTSGHGVCGISRLSARSIAATAIFMATGFATVFMLRHVVGG